MGVGAQPEFQQPDKEGVATREILTLTYPEGTTIGIKLKGTLRLPQASGEAKVERKKGVTEIEIELDEMKPVAFGGDYRTYVLWTVSPEGIALNAGEFILEGNRSKLNVSTPLKTFGLLVTAEPHFLVDKPSSFVVLENARPTRGIAPIHTERVPYRGFRGIYNYEVETLGQEPESKGEIRSDLAQAFVAVELAERAQAEDYAPEELARARTLLQRSLAAAKAGGGEPIVWDLSRSAVREAVKAQKLAQERSQRAALEAERLARAQEVEEAARRAAEETLRREQAEIEARQALERAQQLAAAKTEAERAATGARREREEAWSRLHAALEHVAETRQTAHGLILNLPDILFAFDSATLRAEAREVISKLAGILLVTPDLRLSIEGHTDDIGPELYNQSLSEKRAQSVRDYLVGAGVSPSILTVQGLGESRPLVPNTTAAARQQNRRVEIIITGSEDLAGR